MTSPGREKSLRPRFAHWPARARMLAWFALAMPIAPAGAAGTVPLVKVNDSLYYTEHCVFIIDTGGQVAWPAYSSVYSQTNLASYFNTVVAQFPGTYFSMCYMANGLTPNSVPIYTDQIFKAAGIVQPGTAGAPQSSATVDYCRYNLGGGTVITGALSVYDHELGHAWGVRILNEQGHWYSNSTIDCQMGGTFSDDGGITINKIYGDPVSGFRWRRMDNGHSNDTELYSEQELYLMGVSPALATYYVLGSPVYNADHTISYSSLTTNDHAAIVAAHGARNPTFRQSQKQFRVGFVYIARDFAEMNNAYAPIERSADHFCNAEAIDTVSYRFQVPFLVATRFRASVVGRLADLDGNAAPALSVTDTYVASTDGSATVAFTASDPDGPTPQVSVVPASNRCTIVGNTVQIAGLPDGVSFFTLKAVDAGGKKVFGHFVVEVQRPASAVSIATQPIGQTTNAGDTVTLTVAAAGVPATFGYQWFRAAAGTSTWNALTDGSGFTGAATAMLSITTSTAMNGDQYLCFVDNGAGTATSTAATLTVIETAPVLTTQPADRLVATGSFATFNVVAAGAPLTFGYSRYQWQRATAGGGTWADLVDGGGVTGSATAGLRVSGATLAMSGDQFRCVVTNTSGTATSNTAALTVATPPAITTHPVSVSVAAGQDATFSVAASGTAPLAYQWFNYSTPVAGGTSATLTITAAQPTDAGAYWAVVSNAAGSATSNVGSLTITGVVSPTIGTHPVNQTVTAGTAASFTIAASGTAPLTYLWERSINGGSSWAALANDATYSGCTTTSLAVGNTTTAMSADRFRCTATNSGGSAISTSAVLTVNAAPVAPSFTTPPASPTINAGETSTLAVSATGSGTLSYQWYVGTAGDTSQPISGATNASFTTPVLTTTTSFWVRITNSVGAVDSPTIVVTVTPVARLANLSTRGQVRTGSDIMIAGFVITGPAPKALLIRGVGPGLVPFGLSPAEILDDPRIELFSGASSLLLSDDWGLQPDADGIEQAAAQVSAFALVRNSRDAAMLTVLAPGSYTVQVTGAGTTTGIGIVEIYETDPTSPSRLSNISTRGFVGTGTAVMIPGLVVQAAARRVLVRAVGPTLSTTFHLGGTLPDPVLHVMSGTTEIATNNDWGSTATAPALSDAAVAAGAFALVDDSRDAALVLTLPPGSYTVLASDAAGGTGTVLVEIYEAP